MANSTAEFILICGMEDDAWQVGLCRIYDRERRRNIEVATWPVHAFS